MPLNKETKSNQTIKHLEIDQILDTQGVYMPLVKETKPNQTWSYVQFSSFEAYDFFFPIFVFD